MGTSLSTSHVYELKRNPIFFKTAKSEDIIYREKSEDTINTKMGESSSIVLLFLLASVTASGYASMLDTIRAKENRVTTSTAAKDDFVLQETRNTNWAQYLIPAPMTVKVLAKILYVSMERDFSLEESAPRDGFQFIRFPQSFRASLVQVAGEGHVAFTVAHGSMDKIRLLMHEMPKHFKNAMKILFLGDTYDLENVLPTQLTAMKDSATACNIEAQKTKTKFDNVADLLRELLVVCTASKSSYEKKLLIAQIARKRNMKKKADYEKRVAEKNATMIMMKKVQDDARKEWKDSVESVPKGNDVMALYYQEAQTLAYSGFMKILTFGQAKTIGGEEPTSDEEDEEDMPQENSADVSELLKTAVQIQKYPRTLKSFFVYEEVNGTKMYNFKPSNVPNFAESLEKLKQDLKDAESTGKEQKMPDNNKDLQRFKSNFLDAASEGLKVISQVKKLVNEFNPEEGQETYKKLATFHTNAN